MLGWIARLSADLLACLPRSPELTYPRTLLFPLQVEAMAEREATAREAGVAVAATARVAGVTVAGWGAPARAGQGKEARGWAEWEGRGWEEQAMQLAAVTVGSAGGWGSQ